LFRPVYDALLARNAQSAFAQADETRWMVFIELEGKTGHRWWLWVFLGADTVVFRLDPTRSHEGHHRRRRISRDGGAGFVAADTAARQTVAAMQAQADTELADPKLPTPCRKVLASLQGHWDGLIRFVDDPRIPLDNNASERQARGPALGRKNYYGSGALWSGRPAAMLFPLFATLTLSKINLRTWLTWFLESCAQNGGEVPSDIGRFLPWKMSEEKRRAMAIDPGDSS
jgi:transposase